MLRSLLLLFDAWRLRIGLRVFNFEGRLKFLPCVVVAARPHLLIRILSSAAIFDLSER